VVFDIAGVKPVFTNDSQDTALEKLKRGDIAAMVYVVGKPARLFSGVGEDTGLHFVPIPLTPALLETYLPSQLEHAQYPGLVPEGAPVETVAVGAVMAVYNWPRGTERYRKVAHFVDAFFSKFQQFLQPPRHPKWKEVNLAAQVPGWTRFSAADEWLRHQAAAGTAGGTLQTDFNAYLEQAGGAPGRMTNAQKEALFQQFLRWHNRRSAAQ
jgi:hypothetical protein